MVFVKEDKNFIVATRGDTIILDISIIDLEGNEYKPVEGDQLRFALKKDYSDEVPLIIKDIPIDTCQLRIESEETKYLIQPGTYVYDIQLTYADGVVNTIIPNRAIRSAKLKLVEEVE